jgi:hypothetical protein
MLKNISRLVLIAVGLVTIGYITWRIAIHATAEEGFWFSYYCSEWPVTLSEADSNRDHIISRTEASNTCTGWKNRREINGRACIEYVESKTGEPIYTLCRLESSDVL